LNFPLYIAQRYVRSKSSQNAVNIINFITFLVIIIGSAALFIVLSGFAGLKTFSLSFTDIFDPDLKATPVTGKFFSISTAQEDALDKIGDIASFSKEIEEKVSLVYNEKYCIAEIKGVDAQYNKTTGVDSIVYFGKWDISNGFGVAGIEITRLLGLAVNQYRNPLIMMVPKPGKGSVSLKSLKTKPLVLSGIYAIEENLDKKYVFTDLTLAQELLEKNSNQISGINFKLKQGAEPFEVKKEINKILGNNVILKNRREQNSTLHRMLNTENLATYLIFTLVLIIALFNVVGAIIMMILDKQQNSKTLFNLGVTIKQLRRIYFVQGMIVTTSGGIIGVLLGSLLILSQLSFGWLKITPSLPYPVEYNIVNVLVVIATITVLGIIAAKIASTRISKKLIAS
tara:strand:+ start:44728 stop:45921 length:1194 start_codon:yes stop_codon:yes gene_type:complete